MKINSRILGILSLLIVFAIVISSAGAAGDLVSNGIDSDNFAIDTPSGSDFVKEATTNLNFGDFAMDMEVFDNKGESVNDVSTVMYLKDSSSNQNIISDLYSDLKRDGPVIEENENYFIIETKNSNNWDFLNFNIGNDIGDLWSMASGIFSSDSELNIAADDDNASVSLSSSGLKVSSANGDNVSISDNGVKVSEGGNEEVSVDTASIDSDMVSNVDNADYALCVKDPSNDKVIVIAGNNLDVIKSMAETASFS